MASPGNRHCANCIGALSFATVWLKLTSSQCAPNAHAVTHRETSMLTASHGATVVQAVSALSPCVSHLTSRLVIAVINSL